MTLDHTRVYCEIYPSSGTTHEDTLFIDPNVSELVQVNDTIPATITDAVIAVPLAGKSVVKLAWTGSAPTKDIKFNTNRTRLKAGDYLGTAELKNTKGAPYWDTIRIEL